MRHYYILTANPNLADVLSFVNNNNLTYEIHINRTRFLVPEGPILTEFLLRFAHCCSLVDPNLDLATGYVSIADC